MQLLLLLQAFANNERIFNSISVRLTYNHGCHIINNGRADGWDSVEITYVYIFGLNIANK